MASAAFTVLDNLAEARVAAALRASHASPPSTLDAQETARFAAAA